MLNKKIKNLSNKLLQYRSMVLNILNYKIFLFAYWIPIKLDNSMIYLIVSHSKKYFIKLSLKTGYYLVVIR